MGSKKIVICVAVIVQCIIQALSIVVSNSWASQPCSGYMLGQHIITTLSTLHWFASTLQQACLNATTGAGDASPTARTTWSTPYNTEWTCTEIVNSIVRQISTYHKTSLSQPRRLLDVHPDFITTLIMPRATSVYFHITGYMLVLYFELFRSVYTSSV